jgi:hypothetical protein
MFAIDVVIYGHLSLSREDQELVHVEGEDDADNVTLSIQLICICIKYRLTILNHWESDA